MSDPIVVPRAEHRISRKHIDPEALKVLYRLHEHGFAAYLVGGSVRDLQLGRRPKDFDVGTDAHPYQIKKLFRNCWIIGRRFRLAHIKFGPKTIEVATFRRLVPETTEPTPEPESVVVAASAPPTEPSAEQAPAASVETPPAPGGPIHRDNTFGTPEEDAFRRDFTINGLFYDIGTLSVIDYVGGLDDLDKRIVRSIGDPRVRFVEDPVRMLRAVVMAARLDFELDSLVVDAIAEHRKLIQEASPARLLEEYYKILRSGYAETTFRGLARARLLELMTPELKSCPKAVWDSLARLDRYRRRAVDVPESLTNTILIGALLAPLGALPPQAGRRDPAKGHPERTNFGMLPVARKDLERLAHVTALLPRLADPTLPARVARGLVGRPSFLDALTWLEIFGDDPELVERWWKLHDDLAEERELRGDEDPGVRRPSEGSEEEPGTEEGSGSHGRRRRRRRRRRGPRGARPTNG